LTDIERLLAMHPQRVVIVDEAYVDFGAASAVRLIEHHPNLLVVQTLSKSRGLAGLRVGYALGNAELIAGLERVKNSFNSYPLDRLALAAAEAAVGADAHFRDTCERVMRTRDELTAGLQSLGFEVLPSAANFVFATHPGHDAAALARQLRERAILVRHFQQPRIARFLRISVGTEDQCRQLLDALAALLAAP
jgi:histidinol-phosphate aminotransferase